MHNAQQYIDANIVPAMGALPFANVALNPAQSNGLRLALKDDAINYAYSGSISIADAIRGIEGSLYTWATVKLYYAVFYLTRALLAMRGTAVVYFKMKPHSWESSPGKYPTKRDGATHKAVLNTFKSNIHFSPLLSQQIGTEDPLDWMMARREEANYKVARFCEPTPPKHLEFVAQHGVRKSLTAYISDTSYLYAFDPAHAILALPIESLKVVRKELNALGLLRPIGTDNERYIRGLVSDRVGPIPHAVSLLTI